MGTGIFSLADGLEEYRHVLFPGASSVTGDEVIGRASGASWRGRARENVGEMGVLVSVMVESPLAAPEKISGRSGSNGRKGRGEFELRELWVPWDEFGLGASFVPLPRGEGRERGQWYGNHRYVAAQETNLWLRATGVPESRYEWPDDAAREQ